MQLVACFLTESQSFSASHPTDFAEYFEPLLVQRTSIGSVAATLYFQELLPCEPQICWSFVSLGTSVVLPAHSSHCTLSSFEGSNLSQLYCKLYSISDPSNLVISTIFMRYSCIGLCNKQLGSHNTRSASFSTIMATWDQQLLGICCAEGGSRVIRAARINYFCKHTVSINGVNTTHLLAHLSWFLYHPSQTSLGN